MSSSTYIHLLRQDLQEHALASDAIQMSAYMKGHFSFLGVKSPKRKKASAIHISEWLAAGEGLDADLVLDLWNQSEREFQYVAMDYLGRTKRYWEPMHLSLFEQLILKKSWWDTVDYIAATLVGGLLYKHPDLKSEMQDWNKDKNLWKIRSSIIHQLKYKEEVDFAMLRKFILAHADSNEFFLQKASGWALRQFSKFNPEEVRAFISTHPLMPLTVREGMKYL